MAKINFVLPNSERGWVTEKMVLRSVEALRDSCAVTVAEIEDPKADVNHWSHYLDLWQRRETCVSHGPKTSFWVTEPGWEFGSTKLIFAITPSAPR